MLLVQFDIWEQLNESLRGQLGFPEGDYSLRSYQGLGPAIWEIVQGTAQFYSHKRNVTLVTGQTPHIAPALPYLYKDGFQVQTPSWPSDMKTFVEALKKDTNFVIYSEDHPVTGEIYDVEELDHLLNEKKIFSLRISHQNHLYKPVEILPYTVRICGYHPSAAIAFVGSKYKAPATMSALLAWDGENFTAGIQSVIKKSKEDENLILQFERNLPSGFQVFKPTGKRSFDRSLIYSLEASGEALQKNIASQMKINLQKPGWESLIETTHLCRWGGVGTYQSWWDQRPSEEILRGLLVLSLDVVKDPHINLYLEKALQESQLLIEA